MATTNREMVFTLRMRNQAGRDIRSFVSQVRQASRDARTALRQIGQMANPFGRLTQSARGAGTALRGASHQMVYAYRAMAGAARANAQSAINYNNQIMRSHARLRQQLTQNIRGGRYIPGNYGPTPPRGGVPARRPPATAPPGIGVGFQRDDARDAIGQAVTAGALMGATKAIIEQADAWQNLANKLGALGVPMERVKQTQQGIVDIAERTRGSLQGVADTYTRLFLASRQLGASQMQVARATETVSKALNIAGATTMEANSAMLQLSQGLASGVLQGEELRTLRENAPLIAQAIAKEFGVTIGKLKQLGADGELETSRVLKAILSVSGQIDEAFARTTATVGQAWNAVLTQLTAFIGITDQANGASNALAQGLLKVADALENNRQVIMGVVVAVGIVAGAGLATIIAGWAVALVTVMGPLGAVVVALGALAGMIVANWNELVQFGDTTVSVGSLVKAVWDEVKAGVVAAIAEINRQWELFTNSKGIQALQRLGMAFVTWAGQTELTFTSLMRALQDTMIAAWRAFEDGWLKAVASVQGGWDWLIVAIERGIDKAMAYVVSAVEDAVNKILDALDTVLSWWNSFAEQIGASTIDPFGEFSINGTTDRLAPLRSLQEFIEEREAILRGDLDTQRQHADADRAQKRAQEDAEQSFLDGLKKRVTEAARLYEMNDSELRRHAARQAKVFTDGDPMDTSNLKSVGADKDKKKSERDKEIERANDALRSHILNLKEEQVLLGLVGDERTRVQALMQFESQLLGMENLSQAERNELLRQYNDALVNHINVVNQHRTTMNGAKEAAAEYSIEAGDAFANAKTFMENTLSSVEDALVQFMTTGKMDWKKFIQSLIADFLRLMVIRPLLAKLAGAFGLDGGLGGQTSFLAGAAQAVKGIAGGDAWDGLRGVSAASGAADVTGSTAAVLQPVAALAEAVAEKSAMVAATTAVNSPAMDAATKRIQDAFGEGWESILRDEGRYRKFAVDPILKDIGANSKDQIWSPADMVAELRSGTASEALAGLGGFSGVKGQVWDFFAKKGLAPHQIAGIMGHVQNESGFNPAVDWGDGGNAWGLFQWNDRRHKMKNFVGSDWKTDVQGQLDFAWHELQTTERAAMQRLLKAGNYEEATKAWGQFERPSGYSPYNPENMHNYSGRLKDAGRFYREYQQNPGTFTTQGPALDSTASMRQQTQVLQQIRQGQMQQVQAQAQNNQISQQQVQAAQQAVQRAPGVNGEPMNVSQMTVSNMTGQGGSAAMAQPIQQAAPQIQSTMSNTFQGVAGQTGNVFSSLFQGLGGTFQSIFGGVFQGLGGTFQSILGGLGGMGGGGGGLGILGSLFGLFMADGGKVRGPGSGTSDSIPAMLSNGEFVVRARQAAKYGPLLAAINSGEFDGVVKNRSMLAGIAANSNVAGFKDGGSVGKGLKRPMVAPSGPFGRGGGSTYVNNSKIDIKVEGGSSGDPEKDKALAERIAKQVEERMDQKMVNFSQEHMRPGGMFTNGSRRMG